MDCLQSNWSELRQKAEDMEELERVSEKHGDFIMARLAMECSLSCQRQMADVAAEIYHLVSEGDLEAELPY